MVFTGLIIDARLDVNILRRTTAELVKAWPVLGGKLYRKDRPWALSTGSIVDFESREGHQDLAYWTQRGIPPSAPRPTIMDKLSPQELDDTFMFNVPAKTTNVFLVRATMLRDATMLCFGLSHHLADGTASYDVIRAYCDLLAGRPIAALLLPPDSQGKRLSDRVTPAKTSDPSVRRIGYAEHLANFTIGLWPVLLLLVSVAWNLLLRRLGLQEDLEERYVYLPAEWVGAVRKRALETLSMLPADPQPRWDSQPTKNNIINAWFLKTIYSTVARSNAPVDFYGPLSYRPVVAPPPPGHYWIHNSIGLLREKLTVAQIQQESVATLAGRLRLATLRYTTPSSIQAYLRVCEDHAGRRVLPNIQGRGTTPMVMVTPWTGFDFSALDFSAASSAPSRPAQVVFVNALVREMREGVWPSAFTLKSVQGGGYWLRGWNTPSGWRNLDRLGDIDVL
ncbi:uncharacterized protein BO80DRAFT_357626 [Aspergillus ibericus CBS 121593]|uniref:Transferase family protein n=1 Tax=Aspergillus ibericus CBS 121593 TaxID=1448316 RepID=A0A395GXB4_9EURO|nr:hypothetical protein BO80DRAFT_357626 [Aspergillus ibericus CBS 121593]RAL00063.1 hypothetical protein BO80DRAFT_357626 [Aspergillus ibericus CBS 121593]